MRGGLVVGVEARPPLTLCEVQGWLEKQQPFVLQVPHPHPHLDPCEAANFNSINYFSTQDFGINIQSSIFQHNNCEYKNDRVFFNTTILNIKTIEYFSTQFFLIFYWTTQNIMTISNCFSEQELSGDLQAKDKYWV